MRPVNLLPDELRPRQRSSGGRGPSHVLIGVLGVLLLMAVVYALSLNQANSHKTDIARAKGEIEKAKAEVASSTAFGDFHQIKEARVQSVTQLAGERFDWERMMRELALVLPARTWLLNASTSTSPDGAPAAQGGAPAAPPPPTSGAGAAAAPSAGPTLTLSGCALDQKTVAVVLVRLRKLHDADSVDLKESVQEAAAATGGEESDGASAAGAEGCGSRRFKFDVTVKFSPPTQADKPDGKVPVKLGGGS